MEKGMFVKDIKALTRPDLPISGVFAVASTKRDLTRGGDPYWQLVLQDSTGSIQANIWWPLSGQYQQILVNTAALVDGVTSKYQGQTNIRVSSLTELAESVWLALAADLAPESPVDAEDLFLELTDLCRQEFTHPAWASLMAGILGDPQIRPLLLAAPAAKKCHQAYRGGLLEHILRVARICLALASLYPGIDKQTLLAGAILHDIGKIREYSAMLAIELTQAGMLFGHSCLGLELIAPFLARSELDPALQEHLKHLIISHHGEHEFGAAALPQTPEAFLLHYADNIDAKMGICEAALAGHEAPFWSEKQWAVQRALFLPKRTPEPQEIPCEQEGSQYSLLSFGARAQDG